MFLFSRESDRERERERERERQNLSINTEIFHEPTTYLKKLIYFAVACQSVLPILSFVKPLVAQA